MKRKLIGIMIVSVFLLSFVPTVVHADTDQKTNDNGEKIRVYIKGFSHQYKFGAFVHVGKIWWCPRHNIRFVFDVDDVFTFTIDGEQQMVSSERVSISMDGFFGIAPTLYSYLADQSSDPPIPVVVYGICTTITVKEL